MTTLADCLCSKEYQDTVFDAIRYNSPFAYLFTRPTSGVLTDFGISDVTRSSGILHTLTSAFDTGGSSCGIKVKSIGVPLPSDYDLRYRCGDLPVALTFSGITCSSKQFEYFGAMLNIAAGDPICVDSRGIDDPATRFMYILNSVTDESIPRYLSSAVSRLLYSDVSVCDSLTSKTYNFLEYSANSIFADADIDFSAAGLTFDGMLKLLMTYGSVTNYSTRQLVMVMDAKNFAAFNMSFRTNSASRNCCKYTNMYIYDGVRGKAPKIENLRVFDFDADGMIFVIVDNSFPFKKTTDGKPLIPVFNADLLGFKMTPANEVVDWESIGVKELSTHTVVRSGPFNFGLRTAANDINSTTGFKMSIDMMFAVLKLSALGQFFIKGLA